MKNTIIQKPKFSLSLMVFFAFAFVLAGVLVVYQMFAATTITKNFVIQPSYMGRVVNVLPDGRTATNVSCPTDCSGSYSYSSTGTLTYKAIPKTNYRFVKWRIGSSYYTSNPIKLKRTSSQTAYAIFEPVPGTAEDAAYATKLAEAYKSACSILAPVTAEIGDARGYQAIAFYSSGRIIISPTHTASTSRIMGHEIYHVYDYRDNGVIDWGESIPPRTRPACMPGGDYWNI